MQTGTSFSPRCRQPAQPVQSMTMCRVKWSGRGTVFQRLGPRTPLPNVYAAGAHATPGSGLPFAGLSSALRELSR